MSLQLAAQHLASRGRGPDTQLIHMAPQEVAGLHALAKAHGGSLTTNPDTGLPEAGFLSSILPMLIGGGLMAMTGGAAAPLIAGMSNAAVIGLGTGAVTGLATGSLSKGLMAGLGAFGGAGLAGGLMGAGAGAAQNAAMAAVPEGAGAGITSGMEAAALENFGNAGFQAANTGATGAASSALGSTAANTTGIPGFAGSTVGLTPAPSAVSAQQAVLQATPQTFTPAPELTHQGMLNEAAARVTPGTELYKAAGTSPFDTAKAGFGELAKRPGDFMTMENAKYAGAAALPMMFQEPEAAAKAKELKARNYEFAYNPVANVNQGYTGAHTGERLHFNPTYTEMPVTAAGGGLMDINPIGAMSQQNQSQMRPAYAQGGVSDMAVNPYTGAENFAEGGDAKAVRPVEQDPYNTMTGQSADMYKYLMGQMPARAPAPIAAPAPVQAAAAPAADTAGNAGLSTFFRKALGESGTEPLQKRYTFDPATGGFTALPYSEGVDGGPAVAPAPYESSGMAQGGIASLAQGGQSHLGDYSDGGRLLRGPGDGVSDSIPASIGDKRPARLADGEFVVPARIVSELGNGSTEAGARKLYAMMDRVQKARAKTTGKDRVATDTKASRLLPV